MEGYDTSAPASGTDAAGWGTSIAAWGEGAPALRWARNQRSPVIEVRTPIPIPATPKVVSKLTSSAVKPINGRIGITKSQWQDRDHQEREAHRVEGEDRGALVGRHAAVDVPLHHRERDRADQAHKHEEADSADTVEQGDARIGHDAEDRERQQRARFAEPRDSPEGAHRPNDGHHAYGDLQRREREPHPNVMRTEERLEQVLCGHCAGEQHGDEGQKQSDGWDRPHCLERGCERLAVGQPGGVDATRWLSQSHGDGECGEGRGGAEKDGDADVRGAGDGAPKSVATTTATDRTANVRPAIFSNWDSRPSAFNESWRKALSAPVTIAKANAQRIHDSMIGAKGSARPKESMEAAYSTAPARSDQTRPQRSESAPAGTCPKATMIQNGTPIRVIFVKEKSWSSMRKATQIGIHHCRS